MTRIRTLTPSMAMLAAALLAATGCSSSGRVAGRPAGSGLSANGSLTPQVQRLTASAVAGLWATADRKVSFTFDGKGSADIVAPYNCEGIMDPAGPRTVKIRMMKCILRQPDGSVPNVQ